MEFNHKTVLLKEAVDLLDVKPDGIYIDGTAGGGGHSREILSRLNSNGKLISIDKDPDALKACKERLREFDNSIICESDFSDFDLVLEKLNIKKVDGILLDLGVSSHQIDTGERGFSFHQNAKLDMRMTKKGTSAYDVVNNYGVSDLTRILKDYGEENFAYQIAKEIEKQRQIKPVETTFELSEIVSKVYPAKAKRNAHPARKTFQAIRIEVNRELDNLYEFLDKSLEYLNAGGRLSIITFHSLEDRIVKNKFKEFCTGCTCPPDFPVCVCGKTPKAKPANKKPIIPDDSQIEDNYRVRSAKLRGLIKI